MRTVKLSAYLGREEGSRQSCRKGVLIQERAGKTKGCYLNVATRGDWKLTLLSYSGKAEKLNIKNWLTLGLRVLDCTKS